LLLSVVVFLIQPFRRIVHVEFWVQCKPKRGEMLSSLGREGNDSNGGIDTRGFGTWVRARSFVAHGAALPGKAIDLAQ
jgi:hypothetical protein